MRSFLQRLRVDILGVKITKDGASFTPISVNALIRPLLSLVVGFSGAGCFWLLDAWLQTGVMSAQLTLTLGALLTLWLGLNDGEPLDVPEAHAALLTFLGMRIPVYLLEGEYGWLGRRFGFGRFSSPVPGMSDLPELPATKEGNFFTKRIPLPIWNSATDQNTVLSNIAADMSDVFTNLTIVVQVENLYKWSDDARPVFNLAERARAALRTAISFFRATDCAAMKSVFYRLMMGQTILTCVTAKQVEEIPKGSVIRDKSNRCMYEYVRPGQTLEDAKNNFLRRLNDDADPGLLRAVARAADGLPAIAVFSIEDHLMEVIKGLGATFKLASIGDITLSDEQRTAANRAASQEAEARNRIESARAMKRVRQELAPTPEEAAQPGYEMRTIIAAAQDDEKGNIKIVYVPGGSNANASLTQAAAIINAGQGGRS